MKRPQKFRLASFGLDMVVMVILISSDLHWALALVVIVCCAVSCVFYGEYMLTKYGSKRYGSNS